MPEFGEWLLVLNGLNLGIWCLVFAFGCLEKWRDHK